MDNATGPIEAIAHFDIPGTCVEMRSHGNGHINDTYSALFSSNGSRKRYLLQRINNHVFSDVHGLMDNIRRVCGHIRKQLDQEQADDRERRCLSLIRTRDGDYIHENEHGFWRVYNFVEHATGYSTVETPQTAFEAGRAFGRFQSRLADLPGDRLNETIPRFHNTAHRFDALQEAIREDLAGRVAQCRDEIEFAMERQETALSLLALQRTGELPERVTHNDTKLNNVLIDNHTHTAVCVIDLDTVMPGLSAYDFGELVRTSVCPVAEDEQDTGTVCVRMDIYAELARGFFEGAGAMLTEREVSSLPLGGNVMTFENGIRFLTDYLSGDTYYKISRPDQNLDRCRVQFSLLRSIEEHWEQIEEITGLCASGETRYQ